jgi:GTP-binding protein HflX
LSDTVGFIRNLPDNLIASFKSTLQEVVDSDLLLIVLDANSKDLFNEIETIKSVLKEILADQIDYQYVFNKIDLVDQDKISYLKQTFPDSIMVSATRSLQISDIKDTITKKYKEWISALKNPSH